MEYKVITCKVRDAQNIMNENAKEGWKVSAVTPNNAMGFGLVVTFVKDK